MGTRHIDDEIRDFYAAQKPSAETVEHVKRMIEAGAPPRRSRRAWLVAAVVALLAALPVVWTTIRYRIQSPQQLALTVAQQAALGHNEKQELEFKVSECAELQRDMKSLDFTPVEPEMMQKMKMRIVGARYATIAGKMAAQIVYIDERGTPCTLYEMRPASEVARVASGDHQVDGVLVSVWREKGLLMVLARPIV
jgi:hypothetical protein